MKKRIAYLITTLVLTVVFTGSALASWSFNITTDYAVGDAQAVFNVNFSTDEETKVDSYNMGFTFDKDELAYVEHSSTPLNGFFPLFGDIVVEKGTISNLNGGAFQAVTVGADDYKLGAFTFDILNPVADEADESDFNFNYENSMFVIAVNGVDWKNDKTKALPHFTDIAGPASVPVPGAVWLLGSGIIGLAGIRRKNA
jgi:hypothetical protein